MIDTSALLAAIIGSHEHHDSARPHLTATTRIPAIVMAETFSQLRRTFAQPADIAAAVLAPWWSSDALVLPTSAATVSVVFARAVELDLGGNIHDALIAQTCLDHDAGLVTLDRRQHRTALALGVDSVLLLS
ncbi:MAG: PIN domain-containing protein [Acidimicrobiales bacterium]|nr:PIN domain-containing protein [Acidimicrobiales bacterium]